MKTLLAFGLVAFLGAGVTSAAENAAMTLTSPAFANGRPIPTKHTCAGADISPALRWTQAPASTKTFALICEDPDAPGGLWVHWVIYDIPATSTGLPEHVATAESLPDGAHQGINGFRRIGYRGPCPPPGGPHRYLFRLYALDADVTPAARMDRKALLSAMQGHVVAEAQTMGTAEAK